MLKAIHLWYLRFKLRLVEREIADSADEQEYAVHEGDVDSVLALEAWLVHLARDRNRLLAETRRLS